MLRSRHGQLLQCSVSQLGLSTEKGPGCSFQAWAVLSELWSLSLDASPGWEDGTHRQLFPRVPDNQQPATSSSLYLLSAICAASITTSLLAADFVVSAYHHKKSAHPSTYHLADPSTNRHAPRVEIATLCFIGFLLEAHFLRSTPSVSLNTMCVPSELRLSHG